MKKLNKIRPNIAKNKIKKITKMIAKLKSDRGRAELENRLKFWQKQAN